MLVPGTSRVRTSILATWADTVSGLAAMRTIAPSIPVTLELDVHLFHQTQDLAMVRAVAEVMKAGQSVVVLSVDFTAGNGEPLALANASFMTAPDRTLTWDESRRRLATPQSLLQVPFAERASCERLAPGVATIPFSQEALNASGSLNGGLLALAVEEAVLSLAPPGASLSSMAMRYLRPVRVGPAVATADVRDDLARARVRDAGRRDRLAALATTRVFGPSPG
jgi:acyl-coenzyme A thioesterase PaaI-like protein